VCAPTNQKPIFGLLSILFSYFVKDGFRMKEKVVPVFLTLTLLLTFVIFGVYTFSQSSFLEVEAEQHGETYGVGGTCIPGTHNLFVADADSDGVMEIITGGFTYDGEKVTAQLRIWIWDEENLSLEKSKEWVTDYLNEVKCISLNDVDGDSRIEIVTGSIVAAYGSFATNETSPNSAQLKIWGWDGTTLALRQIQDWTIGDGICAWNVGTGDLDNDGTVEIVTVGCMGISNLCDPDMRIWSIATPLPIEFIIAVVASVAVIFMASAYFFAKRSRK